MRMAIAVLHGLCSQKVQVAERFDISKVSDLVFRDEWCSFELRRTHLHLTQRVAGRTAMGFSYNQQWLFTGLSILLRGLLFPGQARETLCASFEAAVKGLGTIRGGMFLFRPAPGAVRLETLCSMGMTSGQISAIESGKDLADIAAAHIWGMIGGEGWNQEAHVSWDDLANALHVVPPSRYVLCVPIHDPVLDVPAAVLYFEKESATDQEFETVTRKWITPYVLALGQLIHLGFPQLQAEGEIETPFPEIRPLENAPQLIGVSVQTQALRQELHEIHIPAASAPDPDPILILGEKGTGKDLVTRYLYAYSSRRNRPYVAVNCAEITDELATARLFGHKKGSFTGSLANEPGLFRAADKGVLFLDEIGDLSLKAQGTLLRVLENRTVVPLGETREQRIDVQVVLGTNCDPERAVAEGRMRPDLLDRFRTQAIRLTPLRERPWDVPALVRHFIAYHEKRTQKKILSLHADVLKAMVGYSWPGNVRELARVCSLLVTHVKSGTPIDAGLFSRVVPYIARQEWNPKAGPMLVGDVPMREALETFERELILARLRQHNWNIKSARESLGLPKTTFHRYTRALGIAGSVREETGTEGALLMPEGVRGRMRAVPAMS
jgi:DNA-binding NtrC family response regulator